MKPVVDLRSDTVTRPTPGMLRAMVEAELGDDVLGDDPTVRRLEEEAAERSGKEAALFVPSGTMANLIAIALHTRKGDEVIQERGAHPFNYEAGGAAAVAGVQIRTLDGDRGRLRPGQLRGALRPADDHFAPATLVTLEDTSNRGGGAVYPLAWLDAIGEEAREAGLRVHLDGARIFNAVIASGIPLARRARCAHTVSFCFSKGLGAPVGSVLCGDEETIAKGRRIRKMLGGGMRQAGVLAAAALYALQHHVERLAEDHARAQRLAAGLRDRGVRTDPCTTNLLYAHLDDAPAVATALEQRGVRCLAVGPRTLRLVTHLDVDDRGVDAALEAFTEVLA